MAFKLNKRHKLSGGITTMLLLIGLIHMFVFRPPQQQYKHARGNYETLKRQIENAPNPAGDYNLVQYDQETKEFDKQYEAVMGKLDVIQDEFWRGVTPEDAAKRLDEYHAILKKLIEFRDQYATKAKPKIQLSFLGPRGWDFPERDSIPPDFMKNNSSLLVDRLDAIGDIFDILEVIDTETVREEKIRELYGSLRSIGIQPEKLYYLHEGRTERGELGFGSFIPVLKFISHAFLLDEMANRYKKENANYEFDEKKFIQRAFNHITDVKLNYPKDNEYYYAHRQIGIILNLLKMMDQDYDPAQPADKKIDKFLVDDVRLVAYRDGTVLTTNTLVNTVPTVVNLGVLMPVDLEFEAENAKAMQFLWRLSHTQDMLDLENIRITALKEGKVLVRVLLTDLSFVFGLTDQPRPAPIAQAAPTPTPAPPPQ